MQDLFSSQPYDFVMAKTASRLRELREAAGLSQRELARQIGQDQSNIRFWETTGKIPRSDVLIPLAHTLGVTVEEILGEAKPKRVINPGGKLRKVFEAASKLPRRQQEKVAEFVEAFVERQISHKKAA